MIVQTYFPQKLSPSRYDSFLASGWFRGSVMLYKMDLLCVENDLFSVINIRLDLSNYKLRKRLSKLYRKNGERFRFEINYARVDSRREELYHNQKEKFKGFIHNSLQEYLSAGFPSTVFDTREVAVYDKNKLIAVSYFDTGQKSIASLLGLYDESYANCSLGIYTMLLEIQTGIKEGMRWYYPGYVLDKQSSFSYKLRLGDFEYYNRNKRWSKFERFDEETTLATDVKLRTEELCEALKERNVSFKKLLYPFFSMGYMRFWNMTFVKFPVFLLIPVDGSSNYMIAGYDIESKRYRFVRAIEAEDVKQFINMDMSGEYKNDSQYMGYVLTEEEEICEVDSPKRAAQVILQEIS